MERKHKAAVADFFSRNTPFWDSIYDCGREEVQGLYAFFMAKRKKAILEFVDDFCQGRVMLILDVGCGPGVIMEEMLARGHRVVAMDISENMVSRAKEKIAKYESPESFCFQGDIEALPIQNSSVDIVLCLGVLPYLDSDRRGVEEISRVVKTGGIVIVVLPNMLRISTLLDPYYYLCRAWHYVWFHMCGRKVKEARRAVPDTFGENKIFNIRRYFFGQLDSLFEACNLRKLHISGVEYGPLTFWKKEYLPNSASIRLYNFFEKTSEKRCFFWIKALAGQWVLLFEKNNVISRKGKTF